MSCESKFYTYLILDPRKQGTFVYDGGKLILSNLPIYTGKGYDDRCDYHVEESIRLINKNRSMEWITYNRTNSNKFFVLMEIINEGQRPIIIKVLEDATEREALTKEIELIWVIGRADLNLGSLTNKTWGGEDGGGNQRENLTGQKFGMLTAIKYIDKDKYSNCNWLCKCDCGNEKIIRSSSFKSGKTKSCGCLLKEIAKFTHTKHGQTNIPEYNVWVDIKQWCYNENHSKYKNYGIKDIRVCSQWKNSFEKFYKDVGKRPSKEYTLERLGEDWHFTPSNCEWVIKKKLAS